MAEARIQRLIQELASARNAADQAQNALDRYTVEAQRKGLVAYEQAAAIRNSVEVARKAVGMRRVPIWLTPSPIRYCRWLGWHLSGQVTLMLGRGINTHDTQNCLGRSSRSEMSGCYLRCRSICPNLLSMHSGMLWSRTSKHTRRIVTRAVRVCTMRPPKTLNVS